MSSGSGVNCRLLGMVAVVSVASLASDAWSQRIKQLPPRDARKLTPPSVPATPGPVIPGVRQAAIPQGLAFSEERKRILISHYFDDDPACVSVLNVTDGRMLGCATLLEPSGQPHHGHVGGIAVTEKSIFVSSKGRIWEYRLADLMRRKLPPTVKAVASYESETNASFCTSTKDRLWVGEFAYGNSYPTSSRHHMTDRKGVRKYAWVCGYSVASPKRPECVLSVRQKVQGMCVAGNRVFLSISYGRRNRSRIVAYRNPIDSPAHQTVALKSGDMVPLWFLDGQNYLGEVDFPPMSEGIAMVGKRLAVLAESGAKKYQTGGKGPLDRIVYLDVAKFE